MQPPSTDLFNNPVLIQIGVFAGAVIVGAMAAWAWVKNLISGHRAGDERECRCDQADRIEEILRLTRESSTEAEVQRRIAARKP